MIAALSCACDKRAGGVIKWHSGSLYRSAIRSALWSWCLKLHSRQSSGSRSFSTMTELSLYFCKNRSVALPARNLLICLPRTIGLHRDRCNGLTNDKGCHPLAAHQGRERWGCCPSSYSRWYHTGSCSRWSCLPLPSSTQVPHNLSRICTWTLATWPYFRDWN